MPALKELQDRIMGYLEFRGLSNLDFDPIYRFLVYILEESRVPTGTASGGA
jgi:hypothetical protein